MQMQASAKAPVWFVPITPSPSRPGRDARFRSVPSWMRGTITSARMRSSVWARCGAGMAAGVRGGHGPQSNTVSM